MTVSQDGAEKARKLIESDAPLAVIMRAVGSAIAGGFSGTAAAHRARAAMIAVILAVFTGFLGCTTSTWVTLRLRCCSGRFGGFMGLLAVI